MSAEMIVLVSSVVICFIALFGKNYEKGKSFKEIMKGIYKDLF
jgi:hypothetical protein